MYVFFCKAGSFRIRLSCTFGATKILYFVDSRFLFSVCFLFVFVFVTIHTTLMYLK